jgi:hypothetical protein
MDRQSGEEEVVVGTDQSDVAAAKAYRRLFSEQTPPSSDLSMMEQEADGVRRFACGHVHVPSLYEMDSKKG